jgi:signal transduction histidine kinase
MVRRLRQLGRQSFFASLWQRTLLRRVSLALLGCFALAYIVLVASQFQHHRRSEQAGYGFRMVGTQVLQALNEARTPAEARAVGLTVERIFNGMRHAERLTGSLLVQVWDRQTQLPVFLPLGAADTVPLAGDARMQTVHVIDGRSFRVLAVDTPRWSLRLGQPMHEGNWLLKRLAEDLLPNMLLVFPLLLPIAWVVWHGLQPLRKLSERLAARSDDDLSPLGIVPTHAELKPLAHSLDNLLQRLRVMVERERGFVQDAAHELRTPMAIISAQAHALGMAAGAGERREAERGMDRAIARASHLVEQLLQLARMDRRRGYGIERIDLAQCAREVISGVAPAALARGIELALEAPDELWRQIDVPAFQSVLQNLVDNAVRHGRDGGQVLVELHEDCDGWLLCVADDGPGIAEADHERVFERFWRGREQEAPGSGLGLAIVREAAARLGGAVSLGTGLGGRGCAFALRWSEPSRTSTSTTDQTEAAART